MVACGGKRVRGSFLYPLRVVPALNPGKNSQACLGVCPPHSPVNEFVLQRGKEAQQASRCHKHRPPCPYLGGRTPLFAALAKRHACVLGGFNWLLQHLNYGGVLWEVQRGGWKRKQVGRRCVCSWPARPDRQAPSGCAAWRRWHRSRHAPLQCAPIV